MSRGVKIGITVSVLLIVMGLLIFGGAMMMLNWDFTRLSTAKYETREYEIREDYKSLKIDVDTAAVKLVPSESGDTKVVCYEQELVTHEVAVRDGVLTVQVKDTRKWYQRIGIFLRSPQVTVYLPKGAYTSFAITADTGSVEIPEGFAVESMDISSDTGSVTCRANATGTVKIKVSTGGISLQGISAGAISLSSSTGGVTASNVTCAGELSVRMSTGKTVLENVSCKSLVSRGSTGDLQMKRVIAEEQFTIERNTGSVRFEECDAAEIKVTTATGSVTGSLLTEKVFVAHTDTGKKEIPNTNSGGRCEITTGTGNIRITLCP